MALFWRRSNQLSLSFSLSLTDESTFLLSPSARLTSWRRHHHRHAARTCLADCPSAAHRQDEIYFVSSFGAGHHMCEYKKCSFHTHQTPSSSTEDMTRLESMICDCLRIWDIENQEWGGRGFWTTWASLHILSCANSTWWLNRLFILYSSRDMATYSDRPSPCLVRTLGGVIPSGMRDE